MLIPIATAAAFWKLPSKPYILLLASWVVVASLSAVPCVVPSNAKEYILGVAHYVAHAPFYMAVARIFFHNLMITLLCFLLGRVYLGFVVAFTALVARSLSHGYPFQVVFGAHTLLELYAYSLAATRRKRELVKAVPYLLIAAIIEVTAIRF